MGFDILNNIDTIFSILAKIAAIIVAFYGLSTWRKQVKGKNEYELARRILRAAIKLRDAIKTIRSPMISSAEIIANMKKRNYSDEEIKKATQDPWYNIDLVYETKWEHINSAMSDLYLEKIEAEIIFGDEIINRINRLENCRSTLLAGLRRWNKHQNKERNYKQIKVDELEKIVYDDFDEDTNPLSIEINESIQSIKDYLVPYLNVQSKHLTRNIHKRKVVRK